MGVIILAPSGEDLTQCGSWFAPHGVFLCSIWMLLALSLVTISLFLCEGETDEIAVVEVVICGWSGDSQHALLCCVRCHCQLGQRVRCCGSCDGWFCLLAAMTARVFSGVICVEFFSDFCFIW